MDYLVYELDRQFPESAGLLEAKNEKAAAVVFAQQLDDANIEGIDEFRVIMVKAKDSEKDFVPYRVDIKINYVYKAVRQVEVSCQ